MMATSFSDRQQALGRPISNLFLTLPGALTAEIVSKTGIDSVTIDLQHGMIDYPKLITMLQALSGLGAIPMVRLQWNEPSSIMKILDAGVPNLICPMINTREETEAFVAACYYPPKGNRSYGPIRAGLLTDDYFAQSEKLVFPFVMIETADAAKNLESIAQTPGLKGIYVGPHDLSISLGRPTHSDFHDETLVRILKKVIETAHQNGLIPGIYASTSERVKIARDLGYQLISYGDDTSIYRTSVQQRVDEITKVLTEGKPDDHLG